MKYRDFLSKFVGQQGNVTSYEGVINFSTSGQQLYELLEVGEDYVVFGRDSGRTSYPISMVMISYVKK